MGLRVKIFLLAILFVFLFVQCKSHNLNKDEISAQMQQVADWQIEHFEYAETGSAGYLHDYGIDAWTNGVLYIGMGDWAKIAKNNPKYYDWLYNIGEKASWAIPRNFADDPRYATRYGLYHADELCVGQFYLEMYDVYIEQKMVTSTKERLDWIMENPPLDEMRANNKQKWSWCDALFMAAPVYLRLASIEKDDKYIEFMHKEFMDTYNHLYDKEAGLFFRDSYYFEKREQNDEKVFWGRGNGWVVAAVAQVLKHLPQNSPYRPFYENLFVELTVRLLELRNDNGFWHASLLDPESYPSPETSATALITYALAYGVNNQLLDAKKYIPEIEKSWNALISVIDENGKLGYVQPIGADPRSVTEDMTAVYGIGAFLMAGSEIYQIAK